MRRYLIALVLVVLLPLPANADQTRIAGTACTKLGEIKVINALTYKCKKATNYERKYLGKKYIWNKGKPTSKSAAPSIDGRKYGDGALVGKDIKSGRYWSINCVGWQQFDDAELIAKWVKSAQQSLIDLKSGETLLSGCKWRIGEPPNSNILPTGKLSMKTQLLPGRYRPVEEFCMSGPADPRELDAISDTTEILLWEQLPKTYELVITGEENWLAYGLTSECGGLRRLD